MMMIFSTIKIGGKEQALISKDVKDGERQHADTR